jgi:hypothetical protein
MEDYRLSEHGEVSCALLALKKQLIDFHFHYPLDIVPNSGTPESLSYYLYSDRLSWEALRLDDFGIAQTWFRMTGRQYFPGYIAWYGLVHLGHYLRTGRDSELAIFLNQVDWLEKRAAVRPDGSVVWTMNFDYPMGGMIQRAPWVSAHAQGFCISALVRAWRITRNRHLLELLEGSSKIFAQDHRDRGIRVPLREGSLYTEVPGGPVPGILDGFMTSLLGLYDLFVETGNPEVQQLFFDGITGLKAWLPQWDYRGKWSWYGCQDYLCSPAYHCLNRVLLTVLGDLTGDQGLAQYAQKWDPDRLTVRDRVEIYLKYNWTQTAIRFRNRTWRLQASERKTGFRDITIGGAQARSNR